MESLNTGFSKACRLFLVNRFTGVSFFTVFRCGFLKEMLYLPNQCLQNQAEEGVPSFQKQLKALTVEKEKMYKYDKILNGSFRNFVPDHYQIRLSDGNMGPGKI